MIAPLIRAPLCCGFAAAFALMMGQASCARPNGADGKGSAPGESSDPASHLSESWQFMGASGSKLTSRHYVIYTTCKSEPFVGALPGFLEHCRESYHELIPAEVPPDRKMETYLFLSRRQWETFTDLFSPQRAATYRQITAGGYSERGVTVSHYAGQKASLSVLAHEGLHQYLALACDRPVPAWLNEGLACYFESFLLKDGRPVFTPENNAHRRNHLGEALLAGDLIPLRDILATHAGLEIHKSGRHVRTYYAQQWALILFLLREHDNPWRAGFRQLLNDICAEEPLSRPVRAETYDGRPASVSMGEALFRAYVTEDLDDFERQYRDWLSDLAGLNLRGVAKE